MKLRTIRKRRNDYSLVPSRFVGTSIIRQEPGNEVSWLHQISSMQVVSKLLSDDYLTVKTLSIPVPFLKIKKKCRKISVDRVCQQDDVRPKGNKGWKSIVVKKQKAFFSKDTMWKMKNNRFNQIYLFKCKAVNAYISINYNWIPYKLMTKNSFVRYRPRSLVNRCHFLIRLTGDLHLWTQTTGTYSIFNKYIYKFFSQWTICVNK